MKPVKVSENFFLSEFVKTSTGLENNITFEAVINLTYLCIDVLQPVRTRFQMPLTIDSGFRSPAVNQAVGGVSSSQHLVGKAADIKSKNMAGMIDFITHYLYFDQLIIYRTKKGTIIFFHVSYNGMQNRNEVIEKVK